MSRNNRYGARIPNNPPILSSRQRDRGARVGNMPECTPAAREAATGLAERSYIGLDFGGVDFVASMQEFNAAFDLAVLRTARDFSAMERRAIAQAHASDIDQAISYGTLDLMGRIPIPELANLPIDSYLSQQSRNIDREVLEESIAAGTRTTTGRSTGRVQTSGMAGAQIPEFAALLQMQVLMSNTTHPPPPPPPHPEAGKVVRKALVMGEEVHMVRQPDGRITPTGTGTPEPEVRPRMSLRAARAKIANVRKT